MTVVLSSDGPTHSFSASHASGLKDHRRPGLKRQMRPNRKGRGYPRVHGDLRLTTACPYEEIFSRNSGSFFSSSRDRDCSRRIFLQGDSSESFRLSLPIGIDAIDHEPVGMTALIALKLICAGEQNHDGRAIRQADDERLRYVVAKLVESRRSHLNFLTVDMGVLSGC